MLITELLSEARKPDLKYVEKRKSAKMLNALEKVTVELAGAKSGAMTKLARRYERLDKVAKLLKERRDDVNERLKDIGDDLFDAEDALVTRVVETVQYTVLLSAAEKAEQKAPKHVIDFEAAFNALAALVPELEEKSKELLKEYTSVVPATDTPVKLRVKAKDPTMDQSVQAKAAAEKAAKMNEGLIADFQKAVKGWVKSFMSWAAGYDRKLAAVKKQFSV